MKSAFKFLFICLMTITLLPAKSQDLKKAELSGHLQSLNTVWIQEPSSQWYSMGSVYNRLNFNWYMHQNWKFSTSMRNVFTYGQLVYLSYPAYSNLLTSDQGYMNLTGEIASDSSYVFYTNLDRLNLSFNKGNFNAIVGRQRINWGINMVWNPNDIFNTFNFYDFDYVERPGCDAIRMQYYTGMTSSLDVAVKVDDQERVTAAAMYHFNKWNYDFQLLGGVMTSDVVVGGGWSGYIGGAGFTGEGTFFRDKDNFADTTGIFVFSTGVNYTFKNSLFIHGSFLYNSDGTTGNAGYGSGLILITPELSPKNFTQAKYSILGQVSYPFTPLINGDITSIFNPNDKSFFIGPNVNFSLSDNITLLLMSQIFIGDEGTEFGDSGSLFYLRLKWSF